MILNNIIIYLRYLICFIEVHATGCCHHQGSDHHHHQESTAEFDRHLHNLLIRKKILKNLTILKIGTEQKLKTRAENFQSAGNDLLRGNSRTCVGAVTTLARVRLGVSSRFSQHPLYSRDSAGHPLLPLALKPAGHGRYPTSQHWMNHHFIVFLRNRPISWIVEDFMEKFPNACNTSETRFLKYLNRSVW